MPEADDIKFMRRCLDLAIRSEGMTYPNPLVGAVIVHKGLIIGEGYHLKAGGPHAEVNAINSVRDKSLLKDSVLYVNLEPCSHFGKTPPCADLIISEGIKKVVIGTPDTSIAVAGRGIARLKEAGTEVVLGVMEQESRWINRRFFTFNEKSRPYIILKWAQSADGFLDVLRIKQNENRPTWISGNPERVLVHKWRAAEQSILVGAGTVRADNPELTVRHWKGNNPIRLILSGSGLIDKESALFKTSGTNILFTTNTKNDLNGTININLTDSMSPCRQITGYLFEKGIQSLLIEGGAKVFGHFIESGFWDEARIFTGDIIFKSGVQAPVISSPLVSGIHFSHSTLEIYVNGGH
jgi:diaminohydroxyphosphoribosylaminopyrimidine deaminase/5-amino-6-(5-phosphoribosylamino)uracil reductase